MFNPGGWRYGMEGDLDCDSFRAGLDVPAGGCGRGVCGKGVVW